MGSNPTSTGLFSLLGSASIFRSLTKVKQEFFPYLKVHLAVQLVANPAKYARIEKKGLK